MTLPLLAAGAVYPEIASSLDEIIALRHDIHAHPELGFQETRTAALAAGALRRCGCDEVTEGVGGTGVVALIRGRLPDSGRCVALRADMDALPLVEKSGVPWSSTIPGRMHGCGHDGHVAWAVAVARHLAAIRNFAGTAMIIIQPGEEGYAGARAMIEDGLFERWHVDEVYAAHGGTDVPLGYFGASPGPMMASADVFTIEVRGVGGHGARPHFCVDPILAASELVVALQSIASRSTDPQHAVVVSVCSIRGGDENGSSVIPDVVRMRGTTRTMCGEDRDMVERRMGEICRAVGAMHGIEVVLDYTRLYPPLVNHLEQQRAICDVAARFAGPENVNYQHPAAMGAEDFSFMLEKKPGAYLRVGMGDEIHRAKQHNPAFDFNDKCIAAAATILARTIEERLEALAGER